MNNDWLAVGCIYIIFVTWLQDSLLRFKMPQPGANEFSDQVRPIFPHNFPPFYNAQHPHLYTPVHTQQASLSQPGAMTIGMKNNDFITHY
jgi:hypothetical protein